MNIGSIIKTAGVAGLNQVDQVYINDYQLPLDVVISLNGRKIIAEGQIVDGVEVFERVARKSMRITLEFTLRAKLLKTSLLGADLGSYTFPLRAINMESVWDSVNSHDIVEFFNSVWIPDKVVTIKNALINGLGVQQIIVGDSYEVKTMRGSVDVPITLKAIENYYDPKQGFSLIGGL